MTDMQNPKQAAPAAVAGPHEQMTKEIDNVLSDPDTQLSTGAERSQAKEGGAP